MKYKKPKWQRPYFYKTQFTWKPHFDYLKELLWKDKYDTPRVELEPFIRFEWLWFVIRIQQGDDQSWEQWLWVHKYCDGDIEQAKSNWPWRDMITKESTWKDYK